MTVQRRNVEFKWFTGRANGIVAQVRTPVHVSEAYDPTEDSEQPPKLEYEAIWDTGTSTSIISAKVVEDLDLKPIGIVEVETPTGSRQANSYLVNVRLPHGVEIGKITVVCTGVLSSADAIIGMDIITLGDFALTNCEGKTVFSFRFPSLVIIDFGDERTVINPPRLVLRSDDIPQEPEET